MKSEKYRHFPLLHLQNRLWISGWSNWKCARTDPVPGRLNVPLSTLALFFSISFCWFLCLSSFSAARIAALPSTTFVFEALGWEMSNFFQFERNGERRERKNLCFAIMLIFMFQRQFLIRPLLGRNAMRYVHLTHTRRGVNQLAASLRLWKRAMVTQSDYCRSYLQRRALSALAILDTIVRSKRSSAARREGRDAQRPFIR